MSSAKTRREVKRRQLLKQAKDCLLTVVDLHEVSVLLGRAHSAGLIDCGLFDKQIQRARRIIEDCDTCTQRIRRWL